MELIRATDADNEALLHYYSKTVLPGPVHLRLRRMHNFFNQYRIQGDDSVTYIIKNHKGNIEALASLVFRKAWIEGEEQTIGYATDLRVSPTRRAILEWSNHFLPVLEKERESRNCKYIFTIVAQSQRQAYNAFIRPRSLRRSFPRYHLFRKFSLVSMHGLWPFHKRPLPGIHISPARESDLDNLCEYIVQKSLKKDLHYYGSAQDVLSAIKRWQGLHIQNFLIAKNFQGDIIGCTGAWSPEDIQRIYAVKYSPGAENMQDILRAFSWLRLSHRLPKIDQEIKIKHLPFLNADNPDILRAVLYHSFLRSQKNEVLLFPHFEDDLLMSPPKRFITAKMDYGLYCILSPTDNIPGFLKPKFPNPAPSFETAFI